ncbi:membrane dipeptidase [Sphingomonas sp. 1P06PA]|uniref:dipeptidase n=1 Tax=Sphingomonas sp. 1P06PA TaxID=554121 RepID=UPI0039A63E17
MIDRRNLLGLIAAAPLLARPSMAFAASPFPTARFDQAIVIDGLGGFDDPYGKEGDVRISDRGWAEIRASGATAFHFTMGEVGNEKDGGWLDTLKSFGQIGGFLDPNADRFMLARSAADIRAAKAAGKIAIIYGLQDTAMVGADLDRLAVLKGLGVRIVQLTYNLRNLSGDGALEPAQSGLSRLGRRTIERIEAEKLLLDLSHGGRRTIAEAVAAAKRPPIISHTGCRALHDNPRNVDDASLKAVANKGGVIGIYWMPFLVANGKPTGADLVRHMDHVVKLCGEDHVAIGTDGNLSKTVIDDKARARQKKFYEDRTARGIAAPGEGPDIFNIVTEWDGPMRFRKLADGLAAAGWSSARIEKALGGNLMRLYADVWGS